MSGTIGAAVSSGERVLAYFYSPSCAACRTQTPVVEKLQKEFPNIFKVNVAENLEIARAFGVMATPTTTVVRSGVIEEILIGTKSETDLLRFLR